ncbi:PREDICTED: uncharacterized protein LOC104596392 isoform X2 [Nelumbo nucifera]|uniref:Uncharacterized protein LOC104596392 isoform X2 n=1 Tax=Nelumbo nucifera TaxID=4432 RepID=A0A1U8A2D7_NELNU|nr:PREDICTED: uncharacterized protein LOC104596392 isoform X2 [Nelumbo nucifera]
MSIGWNTSGFTCEHIRTVNRLNLWILQSHRTLPYLCLGTSTSSHHRPPQHIPTTLYWPDDELATARASELARKASFRKMLNSPQWWLLLLSILLFALTVNSSHDLTRNENKVKSSVFLSPEFVLGPGTVANKYYYNIDFPRGHIALKEFNAEVVDEAGIPVPLHETYLHHWIVVRYYVPKDAKTSKILSDDELHQSKGFIVRNSGVCQGNSLGQYFGLGSETRKTATYVPDPYGIEVGNPAQVPDGYEERWLLNVHAIDTRNVEDRLGCTECRCDLYNVTEDELGRPLRPDYTGGLYCCYDQTKCRVREGFDDIHRSLYLRYTVKWIDWENAIVPVKIYIFDGTDSVEREKDSTILDAKHHCRIEYEVESCSTTGVVNGGCIDSKKASIVIPRGGHVIYGVAHQHSGGTGAALYGEDGRVLCSSIPIYGEGKEAGNEAGYIVGMSACYPHPGSVQVSSGETLTLESNYSSTQKHTGVMGLFYILVADPPPESMLLLQNSVHESMRFSKYSWGLLAIGAVVAFIVGVGYYSRNKREEQYQSLVI